MRLGIAITTAIVLSCAIEIVSFRAGLLRFLGRWYFDPYAPLPVRHLPFLALPVGVFASLTGLMLIVVRGGATGGIVVLSVVMLLLSAAFAGSVALAVFPPSWLKPAWMKEEELSRLSEAMAAERAAMVPADNKE